MLRPSMQQIIKKDQSHYEVVVAIAKRAREIAVKEEETRATGQLKPVKAAVEEFAAGRYKFEMIESVVPDAPEVPEVPEVPDAPAPVCPTEE